MNPTSASLLASLSPAQRRAVEAQLSRPSFPAARGAKGKAPELKLLTITLPCPAQPLWQNRPCHWSKRAKATKAYRAAAMGLAMMELRGKAPPRWDRAVAFLHFFWPDERRRDVRNAEAAMKAAYDGLVDAGIILDDNCWVLSHGQTRFAVDRANPRVCITIRPAAAGEAEK